MHNTNSKERTEQYFDRTAEEYDNSPDGRFVRCMYEEIVARVQQIPAKRILDLGCGNGNVIALLRRRVQAEYYGLDISGNMIREAEKRLGPDIPLCVGDAEHLPYREGQFDLIICNASFHHYPHPQTAVGEMKRVLAPGGTVILGDPTGRLRLTTALLNLFLRYSDSGDAKIWHRQEITRLFTQNGFRVEQWKYMNDKTFIFNAILC